MAALEPIPGETCIEGELRRARHLLGRREFTAALAAAHSLLAAAPENRDVLYLAAVSERYSGRIADALKTLARFEKAHPDFGRLFQERGHCYRVAGEIGPAIEAYRRAVSLNAALTASWKALAELCRSAGQPAEAANAQRQAAQLEELPKPVLSASGMLNEGDIHGAERLLRRFLRAHGDHVEAMRLLAQIGMKLEILDDAEFLLESAVAFAPGHAAARYDYAVVLSRRHKHARALDEASKLLRVEPGNRAFRIIYANASVGLGRQEPALEIFRGLLDESPQKAELYLSIGHAEKTLGRQAAAVEAYRSAAAARPSFGDAYWSLANLKTYRFTDGEISSMRTQEANEATVLVDRYHLCFALGKALEDRSEYEESFRHYERGNALKKNEIKYSAGALERTMRLQASVCTSEFFAARRGSGCDSAAPIFIVGLPRAGSTLLEQILASHSQVEGTAELAEIPQLVQLLAGREQKDSAPRYPRVLGELEQDQLRAFGEKFIADTQVYRQGKPYFIDKMPNNFRHIGLIHLILPNARIIDARRGPVACCFGNYKQLFASGQEFTYGIEDIASYYRGYVELMDHWDSVLPGKILRVRHEDMVGDFEGSVRRLLEFCGLPFEPACLEFHKTERSVRTASSEQVRRPINREGIDQWRHFEPWLGRLREALGPLAEQPL